MEVFLGNDVDLSQIVADLWIVPDKLGRESQEVLASIWNYSTLAELEVYVGVFGSRLSDNTDESLLVMGWTASLYFCSTSLRTLVSLPSTWFKFPMDADLGNCRHQDKDGTGRCLDISLHFWWRARLWLFQCWACSVALGVEANEGEDQTSDSESEDITEVVGCGPSKLV